MGLRSSLTRRHNLGAFPEDSNKLGFPCPCRGTVANVMFWRARLTSPIALSREGVTVHRRSAISESARVQVCLVTCVHSCCAIHHNSSCFPRLNGSNYIPVHDDSCFLVARHALHYA